MAAPGEFFPQQFASAILQLAQSQQQFNARLTEQRSQAAAQNFMEKQRIRLAENAQKLQAEQSAQELQLKNRQLGLSERDQALRERLLQFRTKSAESAIDATDQLRVTAGTARIQRQTQRQQKVDEAFPESAISTFNEKGYVFIPNDYQDTIPAIRAAVGAEGKMEWEQGRPTSPGTGVVQTRQSADRDAATAAGNETAKAVLASKRAVMPDYAVKEIVSPNGVALVRVGGPSLEEREQLAKLRKTDAEIDKLTSDIALSHAYRERAKQQSIAYATKTAIVAHGRGGDSQNLSSFRNALAIQQYVGNFALHEVTKAQKNLDFVLDEVAKSKNPESEENQKKVAAARQAFNDIASKNPVEIYDSVYKNINGSSIASSLRLNADSAQMAAGQTIAGNAGALKPDILKAVDKNLLKLINATPLDVIEDDINSGMVTRQDAWRFLPANAQHEVRNNRTKAKESADFYIDDKTKYAIPLSVSAYALAASKALDGKGPFRLHPLWRQMGWTPENANRPVTTGQAPTPQPASAPEATPPTQAQVIKSQVLDLANRLADPNLSDEERSTVERQLRDIRNQMSQ